MCLLPTDGQKGVKYPVSGIIDCGKPSCVYWDVVGGCLFISQLSRLPKYPHSN